MKTGIELIAEERARQINVEGYSLDNDQVYSDGSFCMAAVSYAMPVGNRTYISPATFVQTPTTWPWRPEFWKPTPELRIRELQKAGALIAAEIDRINYVDEYLRSNGTGN